MVNPTLAPRHTPCRVCDLVAMPADVTIRLYDAELVHLPLDSAVEYLRAVGFGGNTRQLQAFAITHRRHVDRFIAQQGALAPAQVIEGVSRIGPPIANAKWVDVNQRIMDTGMQATQIISDRLRAMPEGIEMRDLVAVMASGSAAASKRADMEMKGQLRQAEQYARMASGLDRPEE